jgi:signal transduction histidine kinase
LKGLMLEDDFKASILLVDDRPENLIALQATLEPLGQRLVKANSGNEALRHVLTEDFALILMDVQMPGMDGFETAALIKEREKARYIPIIFVTAISQSQQHVFKGYEAGAVDFLPKPIDEDILKSKVMVFVDLYKKTDQIKRQAELLRLSEQREAEIRQMERDREMEQRYIAVLIAAKEEAERANRAKSEFISSVSHELRTPLNAILGFTKLVLNPRVGALNEDQSAYMADILNSAEHLLQVINDILDLSRIEAGKMTVQLAAFTLAPVLEQSLSIVREQALEHKLKLKLEIAPEVAMLTPIIADKRKIKQILYNLLANAVKFTPEGGTITLSAVREEPDTTLARQPEEPSAHDSEAASGQESDGMPLKPGESVIVSVCDTGIGIAPEHYERIFGAFEQVDSSHARQKQGTGLGLALTKRLVELHGGSIWVSSEVDKGSTFSFRLPLHPSSTQDETSEQDENLAKEVTSA